MDNKIKNLSNQLLKKDSLKEIEINDVLNINRRTLYSFVLDLLNTCVECNIETLEAYDNFFNRLNRVVDDFIMENEDEVDKYYNIISLNLISFFTHAFFCDKRQDGTFEVLCNTVNTYNLIKILNECGSLTQTELANKLGIRTTALSNRLNEIKDQNVIRKYKLPTNQKQTYYALTSDCKRFYNRRLTEAQKPNSVKQKLGTEYPEITASRVSEQIRTASILSVTENLAFAASKANSYDSFRDKALTFNALMPIYEKKFQNQHKTFYGHKSMI